MLREGATLRPRVAPSTMNEQVLLCEICTRPLDDSVAWMSSLDGGEGVHLECLEGQEQDEEEEGRG